MDLKLGHDSRDGIEVIDVEGTIDISTAPRLRELLIDLVSTDNCQLIVNLERVEFPDSSGIPLDRKLGLASRLAPGGLSG